MTVGPASPGRRGPAGSALGAGLSDGCLFWLWAGPAGSGRPHASAGDRRTTAALGRLERNAFIRRAGRIDMARRMNRARPQRPIEAHLLSRPCRRRAKQVVGKAQAIGQSKAAQGDPRAGRGGHLRHHSVTGGFDAIVWADDAVPLIPSLSPEAGRMLPTAVRLLVDTSRASRASASPVDPTRSRRS
jgi:hypothetical protein